MKYVFVLLVFVLAACGTLTEDGNLVFRTADPNVAIHFKLLPPPPLPTPDNPVLPTVVKPTATPECNIAGNINAQGRRLYHMPDSPNYSQVVIDESKGEKWFCTEADAQAAGFVKAGN